MKNAPAPLAPDGKPVADVVEEIGPDDIIVSFAGREEILGSIKKAAAAELRSIEMQVLYYVLQGMERLCV